MVEENTILCLVCKSSLSRHSEMPFSANIRLRYLLSVTSALSVTTVFDPMNAHVVDGSSVYFQYGLILSPILNLWNKDIASGVETHFIHEICYLIQNIAEQNVISERQHVCRSLCVLLLQSRHTDCVRLQQRFFWGFSGGTTVPPNVRPDRDHQVRRELLLLVDWSLLSDCVMLCVAAGTFVHTLVATFVTEHSDKMCAIACTHFSWIILNSMCLCFLLLFLIVFAEGWFH